jgi:hypothetical protein
MADIQFQSQFFLNASGMNVGNLNGCSCGREKQVEVFYCTEAEKCKRKVGDELVS